MTPKSKTLDIDELHRIMKLMQSQIITLNERVNGLRKDFNLELMHQHKKKARDDSPAKG